MFDGSKPGQFPILGSVEGSGLPEYGFAGALLLWIRRFTPGIRIAPEGVVGSSSIFGELPPRVDFVIAPQQCGAFFFVESNLNLWYSKSRTRTTNGMSVDLV